MSSTFVWERLRGSIETCSPLSPIGTWIKAMFASPSSRCCCCRVMRQKVSSGKPSIALARKCARNSDEKLRESKKEEKKTTKAKVV